MYEINDVIYVDSNVIDAYNQISSLKVDYDDFIGCDLTSENCTIEDFISKLKMEHDDGKCERLYDAITCLEDIKNDTKISDVIKSLSIVCGFIEYSVNDSSLLYNLVIPGVFRIIDNYISTFHILVKYNYDAKMIFKYVLSVEYFLNKLIKKYHKGSIEQVFSTYNRKIIEINDALEDCSSNQTKKNALLTYRAQLMRSVADIIEYFSYIEGVEN